MVKVRLQLLSRSLVVCTSSQDAPRPTERGEREHPSRHVTRDGFCDLSTLTLMCPLTEPQSNIQLSLTHRFPTTTPRMYVMCVKCPNGDSWGWWGFHGWSLKSSVIQLI